MIVFSMFPSLNITIFYMLRPFLDNYQGKITYKR